MEFRFLGNNLAVDFVNTEVMSQQSKLNLINTPDSLSSWFCAAGLAQSLLFQDQTVRAAGQLHGAVRRCFDRLVGKKSLAQADLALLNKQSNKLRIFLTADKDGYCLLHQMHGATDALALVARRDCELLASAQSASLHRCANRRCILYFVDISKNQQRQWCSMEVCGNRNKAHKH